MIRKNILWVLGILLWCVLNLCEGSNVYSKILLDLRRGHNKGPNPFLNHMVIVNNTIYIGARNKLLKVNYNVLENQLEINKEVSTGPVPDNVECDLSKTCTKEKTPRDNYNKILLNYQDRNQKFLVTCGSVLQGACETRDFNSLSVICEYHKYGTSCLTGKYGNAQQVFAIAADMPTASTVAFIGQGPNEEYLMYVGSTYTGKEGAVSQSRGLVPAISARKLAGNPEDRFDFFAYFGSLDPTPYDIKIKNEIRHTFMVNYITGFTSKDYFYFLVTQPKSDRIKETKNVTRIIHLCRRDPKFFSYIDLPLVCKKGLKTYNLVTAAQVLVPGALLQNYFSLSSNDNEILVASFTDDERNGSAVCLFSMAQIRQKAVDISKTCRQGNQSVQAVYLARKAEHNCVEMKTLKNEDSYLCEGEFPNYGFLSGNEGVETQAAVVFNDMVITSVTAVAVRDVTVAFLGTNNGTIKKVVLRNVTWAQEYDTGLQEDMTVEAGSAINQDMFLDNSQTYLYAMSENQLMRMKVENCSRYATCDQCLASNDPYCGWCTLMRKCTVVSQCPNPTNDPFQWGHGSTNKCVSIVTFSPPMASISEIKRLHLHVQNLPKSSNYTCVFKVPSGKSFEVLASNWSFGLVCLTPNITSLGLNFDKDGHRNISLAVASTETKVQFVEREFTFYNCQSFNSCSKCTDNRWSCDWCIYDNMCAYDSRQCNQNGVVVSKNNTDDSNSTRYSDSGRRGPLFCPRILKETTEPVHIPDNQEKTIELYGTSFPSLLDPSHTYGCKIEVPGFELYGSCDRMDDSTVFCEIPKRQYNFGNAKNGMITAKLKLFFGDKNIEIENGNTEVMIYSCPVIAKDDCSYCKSIEQNQRELNCMWCNGQCRYRAVCEKGVIWPTSTETCPPPEITQISPSNGIKMGRTTVTIMGRNLGTSYNDVKNKVTVADTPCKVIEELYEPSKKIVCVLEASSSAQSGPVRVLGHNPNPQVIFYFLEPKITKVEPTLGPMSGGTIITLSGIYLDTGNSIQVSIDNKDCEIVRNATLKTVVCQTPASAQAGDDKPIQTQIDGQLVSGYMNFRYVSDPTILNISPLQSFESGGRVVTVTGTNFHAIQQPMMFVVHKSKRSDLTMCSVKNNSVISCPTPGISQDHLGNIHYLKRSTELLTAEIGFIMDNVQSVQNIAQNFPNVTNRLLYYSDPVIYTFDHENGENTKKFNGDVLIIKGKSLKIAASREDIRVTVGDGICNVTSLQNDEIYCIPPKTAPSPSSRPDISKYKGYPQVIVMFGNKEVQVGFLSYDNEAESSYFLKPLYRNIIIGVGIFLLVLFIVVVVLVCRCYRRQKTQSKKEFRKLQIQLDILESNVRNECRQAFAELQTDMTDLTGDLDASKKPFYTFESYTFNVLFPGMLDHVILHPPMQKNGNIEQHPDIGIIHFHQLLQNKHFLLLLIRTLEKQRSFSIRDKSNVASLLMILYQNNMEYATEILKALLSDLIAKSVESKHPKLMLRRTESVVEKLLANWLSLCMYKYLVDEANCPESAGSSLYILYKAIKLQVEKGPIDYVTGDARYSLSEDRLLRTENKLEPETLVVNIEYEGRIYRCRVLDCDTISQTKEKALDIIFRNFPYSQRKQASELDLEIINSGQMLLDEDNMSVKSEGWKQLNTLKYYRVTDGAHLALTPHQNYQTLPKSPNGSMHYYSTLNSREIMPITRTDSEIGIKTWHLVKHDDSNHLGGGLKMSSEIYLTRLLATKGTLKQYIDDFFATILRADSGIPPVVKYLFDMMDEASHRYAITDPDVVHIWKCNSLLLRFWVNIIKNPNFVYDIQKPSIVDSCLSVVAQTFIDSCSVSESRLGKDSPSNKLLFAKDIPKYRKLVEKYFADIQSMPPVSDQDLNSYLAEVSRMSTGHFTKENALYELYNYVQKYNNEINESLEADGFANAQQLPAKLGHVITAMEGPIVGKQAFV